MVKIFSNTGSVNEIPDETRCRHFFVERHNEVIHYFITNLLRKVFNEERWMTVVNSTEEEKLKLFKIIQTPSDMRNLPMVKVNEYGIVQNDLTEHCRYEHDNTANHVRCRRKYYLNLSGLKSSMAPTEYTYDEEAWSSDESYEEGTYDEDSEDSGVEKLPKPDIPPQWKKLYYYIPLYNKPESNGMDKGASILTGMARISPTRETIGDNNIHFQDIYYEKKTPAKYYNLPEVDINKIWNSDQWFTEAVWAYIEPGSVTEEEVHGGGWMNLSLLSKKRWGKKLNFLHFNENGQPESWFSKIIEMMIENNNMVDIHDLNDKYQFNNELHYLEDYARHRRFLQKNALPSFISVHKIRILILHLEIHYCVF